ncbi:MAG: VWA domain-containing protein, partial [Nitrospirota bacterium]|nr:VWA domain-containing protein [Nitrospirota bacterium]
VMTAHEVGHLEFGTYRVNLQMLSELAQKVRQRYGHGDDASFIGISNLFDYYPQSGIIRDLWTILEDARVEFLLQQEYPGLREDFEALAKATIKTRSLLHGMTAREMVLDALLLLFANETNVPSLQEELQQVVEQIWARAKTILHEEATAEEVFPLADELYRMLETLIGTVSVPSPEDPSSGSEDEHDIGAGPRAAEETAGAYRSITNLAYRGELDPDLVQGDTEGEENKTSLQPDERGFHNVGGEEEAKKNAPDQQQPLMRENEQGAADQGERGSREGESQLEQWLAVRGESEGAFPSGAKSEGTYLYHEWDGMIQDYRTNWCRVLERPSPEGSTDFAQATLEAHAPSVRALRRYFETIRPTALRKVHGYDHGDEVDLDAAVRHVVERQVGGEPSDRIYLRRDRRDRQVAVAFLIDMSGSTSRQIESQERRVIDVEKEGLVLLSEALEAIGDQYALYGYSGQGRHQVDFLVIKDFEDTHRVRIGQRIEAVTPLHQNRDGAAIRHATYKLLTCPARHRLLFLLSDGKPLDDGYGEEYALEDTKMALREARQHGLTPFCLTIDREGSGYLKRMYGDVQYLVLDDINQLPERLPRIYQRLTAR